MDWALWFDPDLDDGGSVASVRRSDTEVYAAGANDCGQLGIDDDSVDFVAHPVRVPVLAGTGCVQEVHCASNQTSVLTSEGEVLTCGENESYNLGLPPTVVEDGENVFSFERVEFQCTNCGAVTHTARSCPKQAHFMDAERLREQSRDKRAAKVFRLVDEALARHVALGLGAAVAAPCADLAAAAAHVRRMLQQQPPEEVTAQRASVQRQRLAQLSRDIAKLTQEVSAAKRLDVRSVGWRIGTEVPRAAHGKGSGHLAISGRHSLALSGSGDVFGWGDGMEGQLGEAGIQRIKRPFGPCVVREPKLDPQLAPLAARNLDAATRKKHEKKDVFVTGVAAGACHSMFTTLKGQVYMQGLNNYGQCGHGTKRNEWRPRLVEALAVTRVTAVSCGFWHTAFLTEQRQLYFCGLNNNGQLGMESDSHNEGLKTQDVPKLNSFFDGLGATSVACGGFHTAVLTNAGECYTFGDGSQHQLGHGSNIGDEPEPRLLQAHSLETEHIVEVSCGQLSTAVVTLAGHVYQWGHCGLGRQPKEPTRLLGPGGFVPLPATGFGSVPASLQSAADTIQPSPRSTSKGGGADGADDQGDDGGGGSEGHENGLVDKLCVGVSVGDGHIAVLALSQPPSSYHCAVQTLLGALMDALHDIRVLEREYHKPLQEKLSLAKPLMSRAEMNTVFQGTDELEFVLDAMLTYTNRQLRLGPKAEGWSKIHATLVGPAMWGSLAPLYRRYITGHEHRLRQLRKCKQRTANLRKFIKTAKKDTGASLTAMLTAVLHQPANLLRFFDALGKLAPHLDSATDEECRALANIAEGVARRVKEQKTQSSLLDRALACLALHAVVGWPFIVVSGCVLLLGFPWRFFFMVRDLHALLRDDAQRRQQQQLADSAAAGEGTAEEPGTSATTDDSPGGAPLLHKRTLPASDGGDSDEKGSDDGGDVEDTTTAAGAGANAGGAPQDVSFQQEDFEDVFTDDGAATVSAANTKVVSTASSVDTRGSRSKHWARIRLLSRAVSALELETAATDAEQLQVQKPGSRSSWLADVRLAKAAKTAAWGVRKPSRSYHRLLAAHRAGQQKYNSSQDMRPLLHPRTSGAQTGASYRAPPSPDAATAAGAAAKGDNATALLSSSGRLRSTSFAEAVEEEAGQTEASEARHRFSTSVMGRVLVVAAVADALSDVGGAVTMTLNVFGKEALQDLGEVTSSAFAGFFLGFPLLWYWLLGHSGPWGQRAFGHGCGLRAADDDADAAAPGEEEAGVAAELVVSDPGSNGSSWADEGSNAIAADSAAVAAAASVVVPDCGATFSWHVYWLGLWLGLLFACVLWVLVWHWAKLPSMYDCPILTRDGALRANTANRLAVISMVAGYFAFFSINFNLDGVDWPYKEQLELITFQWGGGPCSDDAALSGFPSEEFSLCGIFEWVSEYLVHAVVVLWVISFQLATELPAGPLDDFVTRTMLPLLADAGYMVIAEACLAFLDCSAVQAEPGRWSWMADESCPQSCESAGDCLSEEGHGCSAVGDAPERASWECSGPWQTWTPTGDPKVDQGLCEAASSYEADGERLAGCSWEEGEGGCQVCWVEGHALKVLLAMLALGLYFPVATTSGVLMQPDDQLLDVNTKPIWDITLKLGEFMIVAARIFLSQRPLLGASISFVVITPMIVLHNGWGPKRLLGDPSGNTPGAPSLSVSPASPSAVINKVTSFLLCCAWWTTFCSVVVVVTETPNGDQCVEIVAGSDIDCETGFMPAEDLGQPLSSGDPRSYALKLEYCERLIPGDGGSWVDALPADCAAWPSCRDKCCSDLDAATDPLHVNHVGGEGKYRAWLCDRAAADGVKSCRYVSRACRADLEDGQSCTTTCCDETSFGGSDRDQDYYVDATSPTLAGLAEGDPAAQHGAVVGGTGARRLGHVVGARAWPEHHVFPQFSALLEYPGSNATVLAAAGWDGNASTLAASLKGSGSRSFSHELWKICVVGRRGLVDHAGKPKAKAVQEWNTMGNDVLAAASCAGIQGCRYVPEPPPAPGADAAGAGANGSKPDLTPLVVLLVGVLVNAAAHLAWWAVTTSDAYVRDQRRRQIVKSWMSKTRVGNEAEEKAEENAAAAARRLLVKAQLRYRLFPEHADGKAALTGWGGGGAQADASLRESFLVDGDAAAAWVAAGKFSNKKQCRWWNVGVVFEAAGAGKLSAVHLLKLSLHQQGRAGGHLLVGGREEARLELAGMWTRDAIVLDVECSRLFGEQTDYVLVLYRVSGKGRYYCKDPASAPSSTLSASDWAKAGEPTSRAAQAAATFKGAVRWLQPWTEEEPTLAAKAAGIAAESS